MLRKWRLGAGLFSVIGLMIAMIGAGVLVASATPPGPDGHKVTICHAVPEPAKLPTNHYNLNTVDIASSGYLQQGHNDHPKDIIPPYDYTAPGSETPTFQFPGLNWTTEGQAIWNNDCKITPVMLDTSISTVVFNAGTEAALTGALTAGGSVYDTSTVSGLSEDLPTTGTITYWFWNNDGCSGDPASTQSGVQVGNGSSVHGPLNAGSYSFKAEFSGDSNYKKSTSDCEPFTVGKADPSISTTQDPATGAVGVTLKDKATLNGFGPTGTIKFSLVFNSTNTEVYTSTVTVSGNGDYLTSSGTTTGDNVAHNAGSYHWVATYSGDGNNNVKVSADEPVTITEGGSPTVPAITTTTIPSSTTVGKTLKDSATLSGVEAPNGKITFTLYYPNGTVAYTEDVTGVTANATYTTANGFVATVAGTWHWKAAFIQNGNVMVQSDPADEPVVVSNAGAVLAATGATPPSEMLALLLIAFGISAIGGGALAMRRREA